MKKALAIFKLATLKKKFDAASWWKYLNTILAGKRARSEETLDAPALTPGAMLNATDRVYVVTASGAWLNLSKKQNDGLDREGRQCSKSDRLAAKDSQIRLLPKADRNKYTRAAAQEIKLAL